MTASVAALMGAMFDMAFRRTNLGLSAASAVVMLGTVLAILIPYLYAETRERA